MRARKGRLLQLDKHFVCRTCMAHVSCLPVLDGTRIIQELSLLLFGPPGGLLARSNIGGPDGAPPFLSAPPKNPPGGTGTARSPTPFLGCCWEGIPLGGRENEFECVRFIVVANVYSCYSSIESAREQ